MDTAFTCSLYVMTAVLLCVSFIKDKKKTALSLKRAWKIFINVLPQFIAILLLVEFLLAVVTPETIQHVIGAESGFLGMLIASLFDAVALVPVLVAFPIAAELLNNGAGISQISVFISTLTMVGLVTLRNALAFLFAFAIAFIIGEVLE